MNIVGRWSELGGTMSGRKAWNWRGWSSLSWGEYYLGQDEKSFQVGKAGGCEGVLVCKEKFPLKVAFEHRSLKEDQGCYKKYLQQLINLDKKGFQ